MNLIFNNLSIKGFEIFILCCLTLFSIYPTIIDILRTISGNDLNGLSTISRAGSQAGFNIMNFMVMYCVGAFLRNYRIRRKKSTKFVLIIVNSIIIAIFSVLIQAPENFEVRSVAWSYSNPIVILDAALTLDLFTDIKIKCNKMINTFAKAGFTVYLLHYNFLNMIDVNAVVNKSVFLLIAHMSVSCVGIYLICTLAWMVYEKSTRWIWNIFEKLIKLPTIYVEMKSNIVMHVDRMD